jgi:hypothetical protein
MLTKEQTGGTTFVSRWRSGLLTDEGGMVGLVHGLPC